MCCRTVCCCTVYCCTVCCCTHPPQLICVGCLQEKGEEEEEEEEEARRQQLGEPWLEALAHSGEWPQAVAS